jgi:rRNA pseudouridine-1189 N-methylase Emg1 (Nep1/Mra1 family)
MPRKTVAIRGLNTELYTEVFSMAKKDGKTVADVVNNALEQFINADGDEQIVMMPGGALSNSAEFILAIDDDGEISLSKEDIKEIAVEMGPFAIESNGSLVFEKDVDKNALAQITRITVKSGTVKVPRTAYAQFLIKCKIQGKLDKY